MSNLKIVTNYDFSPDQLEQLRAAAQSEVQYAATEQELLPALHDAEVACIMPLPENWRKLAPRLRWYQSPGAGIDRLYGTGILEADSGVLVTTASGVHIYSISEYVFGSMLMFNRSWPQMVQLQAKHTWGQESEKNPLRERELVDRTLSIVGLGSIGRRIAQIGHAFGMRVYASRASAQPGQQDTDVDRLFSSTELHEMLALSDYVVVAVPLSPKTKYLIGEDELRAMPAHCYLVNIARGDVIDQAALIRALREGWIAGAGLDVTSPEPLPAESPLYDLPNVILTPHLSGASERYSERLAAIFADNLRRYREGQPLHNQYQQDRGY